MGGSFYIIYNGDANGQDIVTLSQNLCNQNSTTFGIKLQTIYANMVMREILSWMFRASGGWKVDDTNNTDLPEPTSQLNANQALYTLPIQAQDLSFVAFTDNSGFVKKLIPITEQEIEDRGYAEAQFMNIPGYPMYYRPIGNVIKLYPAPNFTQANGLQVGISRDISQFVVGDTSKQPGFESMFHEAVPVGMAMMFAESKQLAIAAGLRKRWSNEGDGNFPPGFEQRIKKHYGEKFRQQFPQRFRKADYSRELI